MLENHFHVHADLWNECADILTSGDSSWRFYCGNEKHGCNDVEGFELLMETMIAASVQNVPMKALRSSWYLLGLSVLRFDTEHDGLATAIAGLLAQPTTIVSDENAEAVLDRLKYGDELEGHWGKPIDWDRVKTGLPPVIRDLKYCALCSMQNMLDTYADCGIVEALRAVLLKIVLCALLSMLSGEPDSKTEVPVLPVGVVCKCPNVSGMRTCSTKSCQANLSVAFTWDTLRDLVFHQEKRANSEP